MGRYRCVYDMRKMNYLIRKLEQKVKISEGK